MLIDSSLLVADLVDRLGRRYTLTDRTRDADVTVLDLVDERGSVTVLLNHRLVGLFAEQNRAGDPFGAPGIPLEASISQLLNATIRESIDTGGAGRREIGLQTDENGVVYVSRPPGRSGDREAENLDPASGLSWHSEPPGQA